jgi:DNA-directed RNA polymerase specialized sigma24 family protein
MPNLARWLAGGVTDAEDIVQDAYVPALKALDSAPVEHSRAWLLAVVRKAAYTWLARNRPSAVVLVDRCAQRGDAGEPGLELCWSLETTSTGCESRADWQTSDRRSGFAVRSQPVSNEALVKSEGNPPGGIP